MAFGKNASGKTPMSKTKSNSPAPTPGKKTSFSINSRLAKYATGPKSKGK